MALPTSRISETQGTSGDHQRPTNQHELTQTQPISRGRGLGVSRGRGNAAISLYTHDGSRYLSKNREYEWEKDLVNIQAVRGRVRRQNIVTRLPGPKGQSRNITSAIEAFQLFFPDNEIEKIVVFTNKWIQHVKDSYAQERNARLTDITEIKALIGVLFFAGVCKSSHQHIDDLWANDGTGIDMFRCCMSKKRFSFLLRALRFDDIDDRHQRTQVDKLAKIRPILDPFINKCQSAYSPSEYVTLDEMLDSFRGKCPFRQYMPSKPAKYGIKMFALCCSRTFYTVKLEVYVGTQHPGPYANSNKVSDVIERMVEPVTGTGRNITMDNWFTSVPVAEHLRDDHRLTVVGTVRRDKRELPLVFHDTKELPVNSSIFAFRRQLTTVCYKPKKNKTVILLSTFHEDDGIDSTSGEAMKPDILTFYNVTKGGVDVVDEMKNAYSVSRISRRWPLTLFFSLLNIGGINSFIIFKGVTQIETDRRHFLKDLSWQLCKEHIIMRGTMKQVPTDTKTIIKQILKAKGENRLLEDLRPQNQANVVGRCFLCDRKKNRRTTTQCSNCNAYICREHTTTQCLNCSQENGDEDLMETDD